TVGATPDGATARTGAVNDASGEGAIGCCEGGAVFDGACDGAGRTWDDAGGADVGLAAGNGGGAPRGVNGDGGSPAGGARFASADACSPAGRREGGALSFALAVASFALGGALFFPSFALFDGGNDEADGLATADGSAGGGLFDDAKRGNGVINGAWSAVAGADETREAAAGGLDDDRFLADVECCA
ncbi:MAG: hypothetical protein FWD73_05440, partial [Polyangiaceae bacterium]|nr:hypothetical protein [Polyangiaceae bacterium]